MNLAPVPDKGQEVAEKHKKIFTACSNLQVALKEADSFPLGESASRTQRICDMKALAKVGRLLTFTQAVAEIEAIR